MGAVCAMAWAEPSRARSASSSGRSRWATACRSIRQRATSRPRRSARPGSRTQTAWSDERWKSPLWPRVVRVRSTPWIFSTTAIRTNRTWALGAETRRCCKPHASGTATLWHGKYTNLDVAGIDFVTDKNPVGEHGLWILLAVIGIGFALILWAASLAWDVMNRRAANHG